MRSFIGNFRKLGNLSKPWSRGGGSEIIFGIPPITTNKRKLLSLKAFGGTEQNGTPTPDAPIDIVCNNGVLKVNTEASGKNAVDISNVVPGYLSSNPGREPEIKMSGASQVIKKAIKVSAGKQYKLSYVSEANGNRESDIIGEDGLCKAKFSLSCDVGLNEYTITASFDGYLWVTVQSGDLSTVNPVVYEIGQIYADGKVETIQVYGKNLFNKDDNTNWGGWYSYNNAIAESPSANKTIVMRCLPSTTYYFKRCTYTGGLRAFYTEEENWTIGSSCSIMVGPTSAEPNVVNSITTSANAKWLFLCFGRHDVDTAATFEEQASDYILSTEELTPDTPYIPYYNGGTAIAEMLLRVGDYQDVQSIIDGVVTRNVGVKVLDGTETVTLSENAFRVPLTQQMATKETALSNQYSYNAQSTIANLPNYSMKSHPSGGSIYFKNTNYSTEDQFKTYLADQYAAGTPVIIVYPLATPTTEQVAGQTLALTKGTNVIDITQASLDNLELEVEVK